MKDQICKELMKTYVVYADGLEELFALRRRRSRHGASYRFSHLRREDADGGAATVDEYTLSWL